MIEGIAALLGLPPEGIFLFVALTVARPLGIVFGFVAFTWAMGQSFILRVGFTLVIALPISVALREEIVSLAANTSVAEIALLLPKEFALGYGIGIIYSLPLLALQFAGAAIDTFRGESGQGHPDPTGGNISIWSTWLIVIGLLVFAQTGGLQGLVEALYESYAYWPVTQFMPVLTAAAVAIFLNLLGQTLQSAIIVAAPVLVLLMAVDFALAIASRLAQRFQILSLEFVLKNLIATLLMPVFVIYVLAYLGEEPVKFRHLMNALRAALLP